MSYQGHFAMEIKETLSIRAKIITALKPNKRLTNRELCAVLGLSQGAISGQTSTLSRGEKAILGAETLEGTRPPTRRYYLLDSNEPATGKSKPMPKRASPTTGLLRKKQPSPVTKEKEIKPSPLVTRRSEVTAPELLQEPSAQSRKPSSEPAVEKSPPPASPTNYVEVAHALNGLADVLAENVAEMLKNKLKERLDVHLRQVLGLLEQSYRENLSRPVDDLAQTLAQATARETKKLPSVLIVGLLPVQAGLVSTEFSDRLDLRFCDTNNLNEMKRMAKVVDRVYLFSSKISHSAEDAVRSVNRNIVRTSGGLTRLKEVLQADF